MSECPLFQRAMNAQEHFPQMAGYRIVKLLGRKLGSFRLSFQPPPIFVSLCPHVFRH
jgi:hypothetical protein